MTGSVVGPSFWSKKCYYYPIRPTPQVGKLYFYVERVGGSDDFFQNKLIAANNILTILAMLGLLISAINLIYDNTRQEMEQRCTVWKKLNKQADLKSVVFGPKLPKP